MLFKVTTTPTPPDPQIKDSEFKEFYPAINRSMEWSTISPYIRQAEDMEIIPAIGQDFYDLLETEYQASGTIADATLSKTFGYLRMALANYAIYIGLPQLSLRIGDAGTNETNASDILPTRQWVFNVNRWETAKMAYRYLDLALQHMEEQVAAANSDYDDFANSTAYTESLELFIPNARTFQRYYNIQTSRRAYTALRPYIRKAQELRLKPVLCDLYDEILTQYQAGTLTAANQALIVPIQRLLAEQTIEYAIPDLNFVNDGNGWMISENTYDARPTEGSLSQSVQQLLTRAETSAAQLEIDLKNIIYADLDSYATYRDSACNDLTTDENDDGVADVDQYLPPEAGAVIL